MTFKLKIPTFDTFDMDDLVQCTLKFHNIYSHQCRGIRECNYVYVDAKAESNVGRGVKMAVL